MVYKRVTDFQSTTALATLLGMIALPSPAVAQVDFEWKGECDAEWFTVCDVGPCPTDPDKRHYKNNWGKEGCSPELEFPGPPSRVDLKGANVELVHESNVEITSLVSGGHLLLSRPLSVAESAHLGDFTFVSHTLTAGGAITISGDFNWRGGELIGTSDVTVRNAVNMTSLGAKTLKVPRLVCEGPVQWRDAGDIQLFDGAVLQNRLTMTVRNDEWISGNGGTLQNDGAFSKVDGFGATRIFETIRFVNGETGRIDVQSGALLLEGGGESRGAIGLSGDTTLQLNGRGGKPFTIANDTAIGGEGLLWISGSGPGLVVADQKECSARNVLLTGSLRADGPTYFDSMTWQGGTIEGSAPVEISEELLLPSGLACAIGGGKLRNAPGSIAEWSGSGELRILAGGELRNGGTLALLGPQKRLSFGNGGEKLINEANGALIVQADTIFGSGQPGTVVNEGVFNILAPTTQCEFTSGALLENSRIINLGAGTLMLRGGASTGGLIDISPGTVLLLQSQSFAVSSTQFPGMGLLRIGAGALDVKAPTTIPNVELANAAGSVTGPGPLTVTGKLDFLAGTMSGQGQTVNRGDMTLRGTSDKTLSERTLVNQQNATWRDSGRIVLSNAAVLDNDGTFQAASDAVIAPVSGGGTFNNDGTFKKAGTAAVTHIQTAFDNAGTAAVEAGTLRLTGGGTSKGKFTIADGAALEVAAKDYVLEDAAESTGAGPLKIISGSLTVPDGATATAESLELAGGALKGPGVLNVTRAMAWTNGAMQESGTTRIAQGATLSTSGVNQKSCSARTVLVEGSATIAGGNLALNDGTQWSNAGEVEAPAETDFVHTSGDDAAFLNEGTFRKTGAGVTSFGAGVGFINAGSVEVRAGSLTLSGGGRSLGSFDISEAAGVEFASNSYTLDEDTRVTGAGFARIGAGQLRVIGTNVEVANLRFSGGALDVAGKLKVSGAFNWSEGVLSGAGTTESTGQLTMNTDGIRVLSTQTLINAGRATLGGTRLSIQRDGILHNTGTIDLPSDGEVFHFAGNPGTIRNEGLVEKTTSTLTDIRSLVRFDNHGSGTVNLLSGILRLAGGGRSAGAFFLAGTAEVQFASDYTLDGGRFVGRGFGRLMAGTLTVAGDVEAQRFEMMDSARSLEGPGDFTTTETFNWRGGRLVGPGDFIVASGFLNITAAPKELRRRIDNRGSVEWIGGGITSHDALFDNSGSFTSIHTSQTLRYDGVGTSQFVNRGTFIGSGLNENGQTVMNVPFVNTGRVVNRSGTIVFAQPFSQTSGSIVVENGVIEFSLPTSIRGGTVGGNSAVNVARLNNQGGKLTPGQSAGVLTLEGDYEQSPEAALEIELAGYAPGDEYDVLVVTGDAALGGTLDVRLLDGFEPQIGDMFTVMTFGSSSGAFDAVRAPCGYEFAVHTNANDVTLEVTAVGVPMPGDFDGDCDVDLLDYGMLFDCLTGPGGGVPQGCEPADLTGTGHVGLDDVALFQRAYTGH